MCKSTAEDDSHLFFEYDYALAVWSGLRKWWKSLVADYGLQMALSFLKSKDPKPHNHISFAIFTVKLYFIWSARNLAIIKK